jgi:WD40 repeat protein
VYAVAFRPDGHAFAAGGNGKAIRLWSTRTETALGTPTIAAANAVFTLAFSPDGRELASGGADDTIRLWRIEPHSYTAAHTLVGHTDFVRSVAFSPDGTTIASGGTDNTVRLWDVATGAELGPPLTGDTASVETVIFSHDGKLLLSGSADGTIRPWQPGTLPSSSARLSQEVCSFLGAGLSRAEWAEFAPKIPYQQTCPRTTPS